MTNSDTGALVTLNDCPPGLFWFNGTLGFKSEYKSATATGDWQVDAYVVASGEYFWGGARNSPDVVSRGGNAVNGDAGFPFRRVVLESPYAGDVDGNVSYAQACLLDALSRGEAPLASHLLYTQVLDDDFEPQRMFGIGAGHAWINVAEAVVVYRDRGISNGMRIAINLAEALGKPVEYRTLFPDGVAK